MSNESDIDSEGKFALFVLLGLVAFGLLMNLPRWVSSGSSEVAMDTEDIEPHLKVVSNQRIEGSVRNRSSLTVTSFEVELTTYVVSPSGVGGRASAQANFWERVQINVTIPPGESRDVSAQLRSSHSGSGAFTYRYGKVRGRSR